MSRSAFDRIAEGLKDALMDWPEDILNPVARALYDHLEGPVANQDMKRQMAQWDFCLSAAPFILTRIAAAKTAAYERAASIAEKGIKFNHSCREITDAIRALKP